MPAPSKPKDNGEKGEVPLIRGYTPQGRKPAELTAWRVIPSSEESREPNLRGHLIIGDQKASVSLFFRPAGVSAETQKPYAAFIKVIASIPDGVGEGGKPKYRQEELGNVSAMLNRNNKPVDGNAGLKLIGSLQGKTVFQEKTTVTGFLNAMFTDREFVVIAAEQLGFPKETIDNWLTVEDQRAAERREQKRSPAPA